MLGWWICVKSLPPEEADKLIGREAITPLEEPAFLDDEGSSAEIPPFITTTNARELYDLQPGETVSEAIARKSFKKP